MVVVHRQTELLQIVLALAPPRCFTGLLHSGQQERNQHRNDGNDNEQFDEGETA
jgi:hypothetical protein